jgi:Raf kinase inhibitor-like YbhB/YbcL family protein
MGGAELGRLDTARAATQSLRVRWGVLVAVFAVTSLVPMGAEAVAAKKLTLTSSAFGNGEPMPEAYTCLGGDTSPPLKWSKPPKGTKALSLFVEDIDVTLPEDAGFEFLPHWAVWDIRPKTRRLAEGVVPAGVGDSGYFGPCPPPGEDHSYRFTLYALKKGLAIPDGQTSGAAVSAVAEALAAAEDAGQVLATAELEGTFALPPGTQPPQPSP